jgi:hypothetical protein
LRSFPTIRELDDEASHFLAPPPALEPTAAVFRSAHETQLISTEDAELLEGLIEAAKRGSHQGSKAGHRGYLSARNMIVAVASLFATLVLGEYAGKSVLIGKASSFLAGAEAAVVEVISDLPTDIRAVIEPLVADSQRPALPSSPPSVEARPFWRRAEGKGDDRPRGGTLLFIEDKWGVRYEGGYGAIVPLMGSVFDTRPLNIKVSYTVFGRLLYNGGLVIGFFGERIILPVTGTA